MGQCSVPGSAPTWTEHGASGAHAGTAKRAAERAQARQLAPCFLRSCPRRHLFAYGPGRRPLTLWPWLCGKGATEGAASGCPSRVIPTRVTCSTGIPLTLADSFRSSSSAWAPPGSAAMRELVAGPISIDNSFAMRSLKLRISGIPGASLISHISLVAAMPPLALGSPVFAVMVTVSNTSWRSGRPAGEWLRY